MHYFETFVRSLTWDEISLLESAQMTQSESRILQKAIANKKVKNARSISAKDAGLSEASFRKSRSVLLKKCYTAVVPNGNPDLLYLLCDRHLLELTMHELRRYERGEMHSLPVAIQARYYFELARKIGLLPHTFDVLPLMRRLLENHLRLRPDATSADWLYIECELLRKEIRIAFLNDHPPISAFNRRLRALKRLAESVSPHNAKVDYDYHVTLALLYHNYPDHCLQALEEILIAQEIVNGDPELRRAGTGTRVLFWVGSILSVVGRYRDSYVAYEELQRREPAALELRGDHYAYFAGDCIMLGMFEEIEQDILNNLRDAEERSKDTMADFFSGLLIPLYVASGQYEKAKLHIDRHHAKATQKINKNELLFRVYEVAYYYLTGEVIACTQLLERNFPLFYRQLKGDANNPRLLFLKFVRARLREVEEGVPIPAHLFAATDAFLHRGPYTELSWQLLKRMGVVKETEQTNARKSDDLGRNSLRRSSQ